MKLTKQQVKSSLKGVQVDKNTIEVRSKKIFIIGSIRDVLVVQRTSNKLEHVFTNRNNKLKKLREQIPTDTKIKLSEELLQVKEEIKELTVEVNSVLSKMKKISPTIKGKFKRGKVISRKQDKENSQYYIYILKENY